MAGRAGPGHGDPPPPDRDGLTYYVDLLTLAGIDPPDSATPDAGTDAEESR